MTERATNRKGTGIRIYILCCMFPQIESAIWTNGLMHFALFIDISMTNNDLLFQFVNHKSIWMEWNVAYVRRICIALLLILILHGVSFSFYFCLNFNWLAITWKCHLGYAFNFPTQNRWSIAIDSNNITRLSQWKFGTCAIWLYLWNIIFVFGQFLFWCVHDTAIKWWALNFI